MLRKHKDEIKKKITYIIALFTLSLLENDYVNSNGGYYGND